MTDEAGAPHNAASGFTCPECGGALWELVIEDVLAFRCRIRHTFSLAAMLARHAAQRRQSVAAAGRLLAEAAALNRRVAAWARDHGHSSAAAQLDDEATVLDDQSADLLQSRMRPSGAQP